MIRPFNVLLIICLSFAFTLSTNAESNIPKDTFPQLKLEVSIVHKKGMDEGLVLTSEYQSLETLDVHGKLSLDLKHGLKIDLDCKIYQDPKIIGPSDKIKIVSKVTFKELKIASNRGLNKSETEMIIPIWQKDKFMIKSKGQQIEVEIRPVL